MAGDPATGPGRPARPDHGLAGTTSSWTSDPSLRSRPLLAADELRDLAADGVALGCHGWTHEPFVDLVPERLGAELDRCRDWFRDELSMSPDSLAYPYGRCDAASARQVAERFDLRWPSSPSPTCQQS